MRDKNPEQPDDKVVFIGGNYEIFEVGDELFYSKDRNRIKEYAKEKGFDHITYKMRFDTREGAESMAKEVPSD